ncbi:MAG: hypothetical protein LBP67_05230 [Bacteroidales bacterium]|jgi:hypothetical protein|nr:hypothetical protein [Bacteroidales bacterium]
MKKIMILIIIGIMLFFISCESEQEREFVVDELAGTWILSEKRDVENEDKILETHDTIIFTYDNYYLLASINYYQDDIALKDIRAFKVISENRYDVIISGSMRDVQYNEYIPINNEEFNYYITRVEILTLKYSQDNFSGTYEYRRIE